MRVLAFMFFLLLNVVLSAQNNEDGWYLINDIDACEEFSEKAIDKNCLSSAPFLTNDFLLDISISPIDSNENYLFLIYKDSGAKRIKDLTAINIGRQIAFVDSSVVLETAIIQNTISIGTLGIVLHRSKTEMIKKKLEAIIEVNKLIR